MFEVSAMRKIRLMTIGILLASTIIFLSGCNFLTNAPLSENKSESNSSESNASQSSSSESTIKYQLFSYDGHIMLKPATVDDYLIGSMNGSSLYYELKDDGKSWEAVECDITKIGEVTGHSYYEDEDSTIEVFKVTVGGWTGYCKRDSREPQDEIERRIMLEDNHSGLDFEQRTKNFAVMQIFDDLYAIGSDDVLKMVTSRTSGLFNYETINKEGVGDLFPFSWVRNHVCDSENDLVFYLTSRENEFYTIWKLDLTDNSEEHFGQDVSPLLKGIGDDKLIALCDPDTSEEPFGKMISIYDPYTFETIADNNWEAINGWLYHDDDHGELTIRRDEYEIGVELSDYGFQVYPTDEEIWIVNYVSQTGPLEIFRINLSDSSISSRTASYTMTISGWNDVIKANE